MKRIRTINEAYDYIKKLDPDTALSRSGLRRLVEIGEIKSRKSGTRYYVTLEDIDLYFS